MKLPIRKTSMYFNLAIIFFVIGWFLVGLSLYFCRATQYTFDTILVWFLLVSGLMGNVYAVVLMSMAKPLKNTTQTQRARLIIHGQSKWLDDGNNTTENMSER